MAEPTEASLTDVTRGPSPANTDMDPSVDIESAAVSEAHLRNTTVRNLSWRGVTVTVSDRETKLPKVIVDNLEGIVEAGTRRARLPAAYL